VATSNQYIGKKYISNAIKKCVKFFKINGDKNIYCFGDGEVEKFILKGKEVKENSVQLSRIISWESFFAANGRNSHPTPFSASLFVRKREKFSSEEDYKELFEDLKGMKHLINRNATLRGKMPFSWVTQRSELDLSDTATRISQKLGIPYGKTTRIVVIHYPNNILTTQNLYMPTFIEGSENPWFYANQNPDEKWGKTVDIAKVQKATSSSHDIEGLPEALLPSLNYNEDFDWSYSGIVEEALDDKDKLQHFYSVFIDGKINWRRKIQIFKLWIQHYFLK